MRTALLLLLAGCSSVPSMPGGGRTAAAVVIAVDQVRHPPPPDTALGWDVEVHSEVVRWRECTTPESCSDVVRERSPKELLTVKPLGIAAPHPLEGDPVPVTELTFRPRGPLVRQRVQKGWLHGLW